jgi:response regulator RpfG family c-di-GMP phosphodiesterase
MDYNVRPLQSFHICLVGQKVIYDLQLIRRLLSHNKVTLIDREDLISADSILGSVNVVLLDCCNITDIELEILPQVKKLKRDFSCIFVIVVSGGLSLEQKAMVLRAGANDYFAEPYDLNLIVERAEFFASRSV